MAANAIAEAGIFVPRRWRPEAAAGSVEHADREAETNPYALCRGLDVLCPLDSFTIEHGSEHNGRMAMKGIGKIGGLARGCEPDGTADELSKKSKEADAAKPEPPGEVIAEALKLLRADKTGRWHVRAPEGARHRDGLYAWKISDSEVKRLLRLLWPNYVASRQRFDCLYGGEVSRVSTSWRQALEAALDREAQARRDFGRRREKREKGRQQSKELRRRRMPAEQRWELERKEHDVRMRAINAELDERDKARAARALMEVVSHIRHSRIDRVQHLLSGIADTSEGITAPMVAYIVAPREARLLTPEQRDRWGKEIMALLLTQGLVLELKPGCFAVKVLRTDGGPSEKPLDRSWTRTA